MKPRTSSWVPVALLALVAAQCQCGNIVTAQTPQDPAAADPILVRTVHLVSMCHLDVGFTDTVAGIVNKYWHAYFWQAANTSRAVNMSGEPPKFVFTTHAWLLDLFFACPADAFRPTAGTKWFSVCGQPGDPSFGIPGVCDVGCPSPALRATVAQVIADGGIAWHASNNEPEAGDAGLTLAAIDSVHALDDRFNRSHKIVVSQRDVPGVTRGIVPLLAKKGVLAFSEGANGAFTSAAVPLLFNWTDVASGSSIISST